MRVSMTEVPIADRRRAARLLESLRAYPATRGTKRGLAEARLGDEACPIHRPDLDEVAYWEFEILGLSTRLPILDGEPKESDRGFLIVATGGHDVPIPHFSVEIAPPSRQLEQFGDPERIVKLDSLCYVAEDRKGTMLGHIGTMPPKLAGLPATPPARLPAGYATSVATGKPGQEDGDEADRQTVRRSRETRVLDGYGPWKSWAECKRGYADSYALHLTALAERASDPWHTEALTEKFGQGIRAGDTLAVPMLEKGDFTIEGPGAGFVAAELNPQPLPPRLMLTPKGGREAKDLTFEVRFQYPRETETLTFFVVPDGTPTTIVPSASPLGPTFGGN